MRTIHIIWTITWNLVSLLVFIGILYIAASKFQVIVISGLGLIYSTVVGLALWIITNQVNFEISSSKRFKHLVSLYGSNDGNPGFNMIGNEVDEATEKLTKDMLFTYIWGLFTGMIGFIALFSIIKVLLNGVVLQVE